jgi:sulfur-carrier protein
MIRVVLPAHLKTLAKVQGELSLDLSDREPTLRSVIDAIEARFPMLRGTIRDQITLERRPFVRYYACQEDYSHEPITTRLPDAVLQGEEPFLIVGAMAGG